MNNGTQFVSEEFKTFCAKYNIKPSPNAPGYPATNGQAENAVRTVKNAINTRTDENDLNVILNEFLFDYRNTKHCGTGKTPSQLLFNFKPRHQLDFVNPNNLNSRKKTFVEDHKFVEGEKVMIRDYNLCKNKASWSKATIVEIKGPRSFICKMENGRLIKRHVNQVRTFFEMNYNKEKPPIIDVTLTLSL